MRRQPRSGARPASPLAASLPEVFDRFEEAAAQRHEEGPRRAHDEREPPRPHAGVRAAAARFGRTNRAGRASTREGGPLAEVLRQDREPRELRRDAKRAIRSTDEFAKEPFGWDFDVVRLFVLALLRAGKIQMTSKGQVIDSAISLEARNTFAQQQPLPAGLVPAQEGARVSSRSSRHRSTSRTRSAKSVGELEQGAVAREIREEVERHEDAVRDAHSTPRRRTACPALRSSRTALDQMSVIRKSAESQVILTFNASHKDLKEAIKRAAELNQTLTPAQLAGSQARTGRARRSIGRSSPPSRTSRRRPREHADAARGHSRNGRPSSATCRASTSTRGRSRRRSRRDATAAVKKRCAGVRGGARRRSRERRLGAAGRRAAATGVEHASLARRRRQRRLAARPAPARADRSLPAAALEGDRRRCCE